MQDNQTHSKCREIGQTTGCSDGGGERQIPICLLAFACATLAGFPANAQNRTSDNVVTQADDAFGFSIGRESVGIYSADSARGFSPTAAGNVRVDGLYFDPQYGLNSAIADSSSVKVGLSAQGYPFSAPSGVVDYHLNRPASVRAASIIVNSDSFGTVGMEVDGSLPISGTMALGYGVTAARTEFSDGTHVLERSASLIAKWQPRSNIELVPFWMVIKGSDAAVGTQYVPAGPFLPPQPHQALFVGPSWVLAKAVATNSGIITSIDLGRDWLIHAGGFRSVDDVGSNFSNLLVEEQRDGTGEHVVLADPRLVSRSLSGEFRLSHRIAGGALLHIIQFSVRGRDSRHEFGGSTELDLGPGDFIQSFRPPKPEFELGPISHDHVAQSAVGFAYDGRWKDVGELSLSIARTDYRKTTFLPNSPLAISRSRPWIYDATLAASLTKRVVAYAGYARGLEESGLAPPNAANRNQPLPSIITRQVDAGARVQIAPNLRAVVGVFQLHRPYFGFDSSTRFSQIGTTRIHGAEFSLSGVLTSRLNVLVGGVLLNPAVAANPGVPGAIGRRSTGIPNRTINASLNWRTPFVKGLELDIAVYERGRIASTTDNAVFLPPWTDVDVGAHYKFKLAKHSAALRWRVRNIFDDQGLQYQGPGIYGINFGRYASATLTIDS